VQAIEYRLTPSTPSWADAAALSGPLNYADAPAPLRVRFLANARERQLISGLRRHAAFGVEQDLGLGLQPFEQKRDDIGLVTAACREDRVLATLRLVPTGHGLTGAERLLAKVDFDGSILDEGSWEIGRVIMEPEDRHPDLLAQCLRLTLLAVMEREEVRHFHATTTLAMARLWRRVGMRTLVTTTGESGTRYCLVHGTVESVAAALQVPCDSDASVMTHVASLRAHAPAQQLVAHA
jgi:hypothetical protein